MQTQSCKVLLLVSTIIIVASASAQGPLNGGDPNCDGVNDISDLTHTVDFMFQNGPPPCTIPAGGANGWIDGGSNVFLESSSDFVGIGTSSPTTRLEVRSPGSTQPVIRFGDGFGFGNLIAGSGSVSIATQDGTPRFTIRQSDGNVGIGTSSPEYPLHVYKIASGIHPSFFESNSTYGTAVKIRSNSAAASWDMGVTGSIMIPETINPGIFFLLEEGTTRPVLTLSSDGFTLLNIRQDFNDAITHNGVYSKLFNSSGGNLTGIVGSVESSTPGNGGTLMGVYGKGTGDGPLRIGGKFIGTGQAYTNDGISYGIMANGHYGTEAYGIYANAQLADVNWAGYFWGNVRVTGTFDNSAPSVIMDHPLDPENKYLHHSSVNSPDMKNIYDGNVVTDDDGYAQVVMPDYFEVLNTDFRYQLTVIGDFAQAIIAEEISNGEFVIRTDQPNVKVSWQVTGIRHDQFAEANRIQVEVTKSQAERGLYLHPEEHGQPIERSVDYKKHKESLEQRTEISRNAE